MRSEDSMKRGGAPVRPDESRNAHQSVTLLEAIEEFRFDALIGGARRRGEGPRQGAHLLPPRRLRPVAAKAQRPELWTLFNTRLQPGEHFRVFPISNWTELDVAVHRARGHRAALDLLRAQRQVIERRGLLVPVTDITPPKDGEEAVTRTVRFRTVGDITCTCPVESPAANATEVVAETLLADVSERGATRMDDKTSDASMEKRKKDGYF